MNYNPEKHHRRSIRLQGYDYTREGAYYFTICCHQRRCLLGEIKDGVMHLNLVGATVKVVWDNLPHHFPLKNSLINISRKLNKSFLNSPKESIGSSKHP